MALVKIESGTIVVVSDEYLKRGARNLQMFEQVDGHCWTNRLTHWRVGPYLMAIIVAIVVVVEILMTPTSAEVL